MKKYQPKRATKRWLEGAPEYVLSCHREADGDYAVWIGGSQSLPIYQGQHWVDYLELTSSGASMSGSVLAHERAAYLRRRPKCRWLDMPESVRKEVINRVELVSARDVETMARAYLTCAIQLAEETESAFPPRVPEATHAAAMEAVRSMPDDLLNLALANGWTAEQLGHDLWLTRNGHGSGYWDRDMPFNGELTAAAKALGTQALEISRGCAYLYP